MREILDGGQLDRLEYEHKRMLFEAQQRSATEKSNGRSTFVSVFFAGVVMVAIVAQVVAALYQYRLAKWAADHPAPTAVCKP